LRFITRSTRRWKRFGKRRENIGAFYTTEAVIVSGGVMARKKKPAAGGKMLIRIERTIRAIPRGKVSTYGGIARIAGFPGAARMVARVLSRGFGLPWQRVLGAGGEIKLRGDSAMEQRFRLETEGVRFRGRKVDMKAHEWKAKRARYRN
jgi:methylated-DNA-protein-cysteine methyltransferase related protein